MTLAVAVGAVLVVVVLIEDRVDLARGRWLGVGAAAGCGEGSGRVCRRLRRGVRVGL